MGKKAGSGSRMNNPNPDYNFRELRNTFLGLKYFNSLRRIRDPGWNKFGSGMENIWIRDPG
jgi:hypothetical protein